MKNHPVHGTNKLVSDYYCRVTETPLDGRVIADGVVQNMKLPTQVQLVMHAYHKAIPNYSRAKAMDQTGADLTPSLKKLPLCNNLLRRAMLMKPPARVVKRKPVLSEQEHKAKLELVVQGNREKEKNRRKAKCPYLCGWETNYKYKKQVNCILFLEQVSGFD